MARHDAAERVAPQVEARPDPVVSVAYTNDSLDDLTLGSSPDSILAFSWAQELPYPGKRRLAGDVARADVEVSARALDTVRTRVRAEVKLAYVELHRLERTRSLLEESRTLLQSFLEAARSRYEVGAGILENVLKAQTESLRLDAELTLLAQERRGAEVQLNALLGKPADMPMGPARAAPLLEAMDREALERTILEQSPEIGRLRATAGKEETRLRLARRNLKPDLMWGASYMNRGGLDPMVMGMFGLRLPLYRKRKQAEAVVQSEYELEASRRDVAGGEVRVLAAARNLVARAERARTLQQLYREGIIPQAQSALDSATAAYAVGRAEFVTLIDDFLSTLEYQRDYETQRAEEAAALAALEPLSGASLLRPASAGGGSDE